MRVVKDVDAEAAADGGDAAGRCTQDVRIYNPRARGGHVVRAVSFVRVKDTLYVYI